MKIKIIDVTMLKKKIKIVFNTNVKCFISYSLMYTAL